ncbi:MAG: hypothetical protein ACFFER_03540 [Candidatus Thorarchaeota archaeon]
MTIRGPLKGKKNYLKKMLDPEGIILQDFIMVSEEPDVILYRFIWDTELKPDTVAKESKYDIPTIDTRPHKIIARINEIENSLEEHFEGYEVKVLLDSHTLKTVREKGRNVARSMAKIRFDKLP